MVQRYSRLVIGVCRRVLRSEHDIEDAFQATFLVLARDAGRIKKSASLASWLHGVAYRTSLRASHMSHRRRRLLRDVTMTHDPIDNSTAGGPFAELEDRDQRQALDEELAALPENYRAPLVLHYLEEKSNQQVADELGLSVSALEGRLKRGKKELRLRLARRGVGLSVAVAAMHAMSSSSSAASLEPLIARTIDAGLSFAGGVVDAVGLSGGGRDVPGVDQRIEGVDPDERVDRHLAERGLGDRLQHPLVVERGEHRLAGGGEARVRDRRRRPRPPVPRGEAVRPRRAPRPRVCPR